MEIKHPIKKKDFCGRKSLRGPKHNPAGIHTTYLRKIRPLGTGKNCCQEHSQAKQNKRLPTTSKTHENTLSVAHLLLSLLHDNSRYKSVKLNIFCQVHLVISWAGIQNDGVAFDAITIAPTVAGDLQAVTATVGTARGDVTVHWQHTHEVCAVGFEGELKSLQPAVVNCSARGIISKIKFASYGNPTGGCGNWTAGCAAKQSLEVVEALCVGKAVCSVNASNAAFNTTDPCPGIPKTLAIEAECSSNFAMQTAIPVGSTATVRLPLIPPTSAAANVTVKEGGVVVFAAGSFKAGAVHGVLNASADETLAGKVVAVTVTSGNYQWTIE